MGKHLIAINGKKVEFIDGKIFWKLSERKI
jgi:hypothetical protein